MNYFLINNKDGVYTIADGPRELPIIYKNVSNFNELENSDPELLKNLSWLGEAELGFWLKDPDDEPSYTWMQKLQESYTVNPDQQNVKISFQVVDLTQEEVDLKKNNWLNEIRLIRNRYLQTTDFTQLIDAPFTEEEKNGSLCIHSCFSHHRPLLAMLVSCRPALSSCPRLEGATY